jgi:glycosyltransferase involved in cell wall biosynthesis
MAFVNSSADSDWFHQLGDILDYTGVTKPAELSKYVWASEFCKGKKVVELDCRSGAGVSILSRVAQHCTGFDRNREAIKYARRNFFVRGKTVFAHWAADVDDFGDYDVIVSFNRGTTATAMESITGLARQIFGSRGSAQQSEKVLLFGLECENAELREFVKALDRLSSDASIKYSLYFQSRDNLSAIAPIEKGSAGKGGRLIAVLSGPGKKPIPDRSPPDARQDLVSVVIPTYNRADLIGEAVDSALSQTYSNIEVLVVDDGSTDNTRQVIAKYGSKVKYFWKENGGIASALNHGIRHMSGRWFKWLSSDDVLMPDAVETLVGGANETGGLIFYTNYQIIDAAGQVVRQVVEPGFESYFEYASALWNRTRFMGNGGTTLIEKSCFDEVGLFDESLRSAEDYDWWLRACLLHGHMFFHIPKNTLKYRVHGKQLTASVNHNAYVTSEKIRTRIRQEIMKANPHWWDVLTSYRKKYSKQSKLGNPARRLLRRSLLHMPEGMRKSALRTWQRSLKPKLEPEDQTGK